MLETSTKKQVSGGTANLRLCLHAMIDLMIALPQTHSWVRISREARFSSMMMISIVFSLRTGLFSKDWDVLWPWKDVFFFWHDDFGNPLNCDCAGLTGGGLGLPALLRAVKAVVWIRRWWRGWYRFVVSLLRWVGPHNTWLFHTTKSRLSG